MFGGQRSYNQGKNAEIEGGDEYDDFGMPHSSAGGSSSNVTSSRLLGRFRRQSASTRSQRSGHASAFDNFDDDDDDDNDHVTVGSASHSASAGQDVSMAEISMLRDRQRYPSMVSNGNGRAMSMTGLSSSHDTAPIIPTLSQTHIPGRSNRNTTQDRYRQKLIDSRRALLNSDIGAVPATGSTNVLPLAGQLAGVDDLGPYPGTSGIAGGATAPGGRSMSMSTTNNIPMMGGPVRRSIDSRGSMTSYSGGSMTSHSGGYGPPYGGPSLPAPPHVAHMRPAGPGGLGGPGPGPGPGMHQPPMLGSPYGTPGGPAAAHPNFYPPSLAGSRPGSVSGYGVFNPPPGTSQSAYPGSGAAYPGAPIQGTPQNFFEPGNLPDRPHTPQRSGAGPMTPNASRPQDDFDFESPLMGRDSSRNLSSDSRDKTQIQTAIEASELEPASERIRELEEEVRVLSIELGEAARRELNLSPSHEPAQTAAALARAHNELALERRRTRQLTSGRKLDEEDVAELEHRHAEATHLLDIRTEQYAQLQKQYDQMSKDLEEAEGEAARLRKQNRELEASVQARELGDSSKHVRTLEAENKRLQAQLDEISDRSPLADRMRQLEEQRSVLQETLRTMRSRKDAEISSLRDRIASSSSALSLHSAGVEVHSRTASGASGVVSGYPSGLSTGGSSGYGSRHTSVPAPIAIPTDDSTEFSFDMSDEGKPLNLPRLRTDEGQSRPASPLHLSFDIPRQMLQGK